MKIVIIGANGFLAKALIAFFIERGDKLTLVARTNPNNPNCIFYQADLLTKEISGEIYDQSDIVIYAAGLGIQSTKEYFATDLYTINTFLPIHLAETLLKNNYKGKLITFGSYFEIGNNNESEKKYTEEDVIFSDSIGPNDYCISKRLLTRYFFDKKFPFTNYHCILPTIYGVGENPKRLIPYVINSVINKQQLKLTAGYQIRQYLFVNDAAIIVSKMIDGNIPSGIYNIPSAETLSVRSLVHEMGNSLHEKIGEDVFGLEQRSDLTMQVLQMSSEKLAALISYPDLFSIKKFVVQTISK